MAEVMATTYATAATRVAPAALALWTTTPAPTPYRWLKKTTHTVAFFNHLLLASEVVEEDHPYGGVFQPPLARKGGAGMVRDGEARAGGAGFVWVLGRRG